MSIRKLLIALALVLALGLAVGTFETWVARAQGPGGDQPCPNGGWGHGMMGGWGRQNCPYAGDGTSGRGMMGPMMGGYGQSSSGGMMQGGMMGGYGQSGSGGMMQGGMMGGYGQFGTGGMMGGNGPFGTSAGMMGGWAPPADLAPAGSTATLDEAVKIAGGYVAAWDDPNLALGEVLQFEWNFYALAVEVDSGRAAFEFLIDPASGAVYLEPGPNMMWNQRYGMHAGANVPGMWNAPTGADGVEMTVSAGEAQEAAQGYLDRLGTGLTVSAEPDVFYGYYTFEALEDGQVAGMLSVNGYTGDVWAHHWHGNFIAEVE